MKTITREKTLEHLKNYLEGKISKEDIYEWALKIVISKEYPFLQDELLSETIQALFELHHYGEEERFDPTIEELEYYKNCLEGKIEFKKER